MADSLPETNLLTFCLWLLRRRRRLKIVGNSMLPLLQPGEEILMDINAYKQAKPKINDIVVTIQPRDRITIVKRVKQITPDGKYFLVGDNPSQSTDSRHWGTVSHQDILGKVTNRF